MDHNDKNSSSMMWMMVICCALPIAIIFFGGAALFSGGYIGIILIGVLALICIGMMIRGHGHGASGEEHHDMANMVQPSAENTASADDDKGHSNHSGCH